MTDDIENAELEESSEDVVMLFRHCSALRSGLKQCLVS